MQTPGRRAGAGPFLSSGWNVGGLHRLARLQALVQAVSRSWMSGGGLPSWRVLALQVL